MSIGRVVAAMLLALSATLPVGAEVFRWVDEQGQVHFGDCPPPDCRPEQVRIDPGPSDASVRAAEERAERLRAAERDLRQQLAAPPAGEVRGSVVAPGAGADAGPACFSTLADAWDGAIADTREAVMRSPLSSTEHRQLRGLLDAFARRRRGEVEETICIRPEATPPTLHETYRADVHGFWKSDDVLQVGTELLGQESGKVSREYFWILSSRDGLRFREATTDTVFVLDQPRNDVAVIALTSGSLTFFRRQGGNQRRVTVHTLRTTPTGVGMEEYLYVQGSLAGKRIWRLGR